MAEDDSSLPLGIITHDGGPLTLHFDNHGETLARGLWNLARNKRLLDFEMTLDDNWVPAHRLILEIFLKPETLELGRTLIQPDVCCLKNGTDRSDEGCCLDAVLEFLYTGRVSVARDRLDGLVEVAQRLDLPALAEAVHLAVAKEAEPLDAGLRRTARRRKQTIVRRIGRQPELATTNKVEKLSVSSQKKQALVRRSRRNPGGSSKSPPTDGSLRKSEKDSVWEPGKEKSSMTSNAESSDSGTGSRKTEGKGRKLPGAPKKKWVRPNNAERCRLWLDKQPLLRCDSCNYETRHKMSFGLHRAKHHGTVEMFKCVRCNRNFLSEAAATRHEDNAHRGEPELFRCESCNFSTPNQRYYDSHQRLVHKAAETEKLSRGVPLPILQCPECDFTCVHPSKLKLHHLVKHLKDAAEKPFRCELCPYSSFRRNDLHKHIRHKHEKLRPFICYICGAKCAHQTALKQHIRIHTGERPYVCSICGQASGDASTLKKHMRRHLMPDEKPYVCHLCGHASRRRDNLRVHLKGVHKVAMEQQKLEVGTWDRISEQLTKAVGDSELLPDLAGVP